MGIRMGSLSGLGPPCAAGGDDDGLGPSSPGIAGSSGIFEAPYGDLPECFHISPEAQTHYPAEIQRAIYNVKFIHYHQIQQDKFDEVGAEGRGEGGGRNRGRGGWNRGRVSSSEGMNWGDDQGHGQGHGQGQGGVKWSRGRGRGREEGRGGKGKEQGHGRGW